LSSRKFAETTDGNTLKPAPEKCNGNLGLILAGEEPPMRRATTMNRRSFLLRAGAGTLGALTGFDARSEPLGSGFLVGCYTRAFDQFDYRTAMDAIAEAGYAYVGIMTTKTKEWIMIRNTTPPEEVQTIQHEAEKRKLKIISVYGDFTMTESVEQGVRDLKQLIDHTVTCKCPNLLLGGSSDPKLYAPYFQAVKECCAYAAEKSVGLSIKPHGGEISTGPACRKAIGLVSKPNFWLWYDPGNIFYYSDGALDPVKDAASVDGLVAGMSIKDFRPPKEVLVDIGAGKVDFPKVMQRLRKGGFNKGPLVVECLERGDLPKLKASATRAREYINSVLAA